MRVELADDAIGQRLDRALVVALEQCGIAVTRSQLARAFEQGSVCREGRPLKPGRVVDGPLVLDVVVPKPEPLVAIPEPVPLSIVFEDDWLLVVDKPAGMVVHPSAGHSRGTLVNGVLHHLALEADALPVLPGNDASRPGIVHRLDKDTSGIMVVAKSMQAQARLAACFARHDIERRYVGVVLGRPSWEETRLETLHGRDPAHRRRFSPDVPRGRRAVTLATVVERWAHASFVRFVLETGRTHQIRMHAKALAHPIFGDALYARPPREPELKRRWTDLGRHALHAEHLGLTHPITGQSMHWASPLPAELIRLCDGLKQLT